MVDDGESVINRRRIAKMSSTLFILERKLMDIYKIVRAVLFGLLRIF